MTIFQDWYSQIQLDFVYSCPVSNSNVSNYFVSFLLHVSLKFELHFISTCMLFFGSSSTKMSSLLLLVFVFLHLSFFGFVFVYSSFIVLYQFCLIFLSCVLFFNNLFICEFVNLEQNSFQFFLFINEADVHRLPKETRKSYLKWK